MSEDPTDADRHAAALRRRALEFLAVVPLGTRLVIRAYERDSGSGDRAGARDALGDLIARSDGTCTVRTKRADVEVRLADVVAAKQVPPPPAPRPRRHAS